MKTVIITLTLIVCSMTPALAKEKIRLFAAASTTNVVKELIAAYQLTSGSDDEILTSFASSGTLARQIEAGAEADIFISANTRWFIWLEDRNLIEPDKTATLAENSLVLVSATPRGKALATIDSLPQALTSGYLAIGDFAHVPAGLYAKEALEHFGIWDKVKKNLALYPTVRVALNSVLTSQADLAIVYRTDALQTEKLRIIYTFPPSSHTPISYPVGTIQGKRTGATDRFMAFLGSAAGREVLDRYGFKVP